MPKSRKIMYQKELSKILKDHHKKMRKDPESLDFLVIKNRDLSNLMVSSKYYDLRRIKEDFTGTDGQVFFNLDIALMISKKHNPKKVSNSSE